MDIRKLSNKIVKKYDSRNPFEIVNGCGAILIFAPLKGVRGFYQYFQRNHLFYIDENLPNHIQKFVCAHELGHMFMHRGMNAIFMDTRTYLNTSQYEVEANRFAIELLIPDEVILEYYNYTADQLARLLGYEEKLIELKISSYYEI